MSGFLGSMHRKSLSPPNRWQAQRKVVTIPKSVTPARILQNLQVSSDGDGEFQQCPFMWVTRCPATWITTVWGTCFMPVKVHVHRREVKDVRKPEVSSNCVCVCTDIIWTLTCNNWVGLWITSCDFFSALNQTDWQVACLFLSKGLFLQLLLPLNQSLRCMLLETAKTPLHAAVGRGLDVCGNRTKREHLEEQSHGSSFLWKSIHKILLLGLNARILQ